MPAYQHLPVIAARLTDSHGTHVPAGFGQWRRYQPAYRRDIPADCLNWLLEPGSLTRRLVQACGHHPFRVKLRAERYQYVTLDESRALGVSNGIKVLVREVQLLCDESPWVYARSLIPVTSLKGPLQRLKRQGSRSLGATLFADRTLRRGPLEIRCVDAAEVPVEMDGGGKRVNVWGRRSVFHVQNQPLLVSEYFLPALFKHQNKSIKV